MTTVIYHSADYDGIFCREIARINLPPDTTFLGWTFGEPKITVPGNGFVYLLDLPPDCLDDAVDTDRLVWIDHHKSSIEKWKVRRIDGYRIEGVAACRLAWQWFTGDLDNLPNLEAYKNRMVREPLAVRLAGEYDVWDDAPSNGKDISFQFGLDSQESLSWELLLKRPGRSGHWRALDYVERLVKDGETARRCIAKRDADMALQRSYLMKWEGLTFLTLNIGRGNSNTFASLDVPSTGHDALAAYGFNGKIWTVSLYHAKHRTDIDLSKIAVLNGGGGHRGACGFTCSTLPSAFTDHCSHIPDPNHNKP